jgi:hypothetical protein
MRHNPTAIQATLTAAERAAPFAVQPLAERLNPGPTRTYTESDGVRWWEIDRASGEVLAEGVHAPHAPLEHRSELQAI